MATWSPFRRPGAPRSRRAAGNAFWIGLAALTVVILVVGRSDHPVARKMQLWANELASPVLEVVRIPFDAGVAAWNSAGDLIHAFGELDQARADLRKVTAERDALRLMQQENRHLRGLLGLVAPEAEPVAAVRVTGSAGGAFVQNLLVSGGSQTGIEKDMIVIDGQGLVGRIIDVGPFASRVLLITDYNSRVPVRFEQSGQTAILAGQNSATLELINMAPNYHPRVGDRIVTSGHGGIFPHDIPVARVTIVRGRTVEARAVAALDAIDYLRILRLKAQPKAPAPTADRVPAANQPVSSDGSGVQPEASPEQAPVAAPETETPPTSNEARP